MTLDESGRYMNPCTDCAYLSGATSSTTARVVLGGAWDSAPPTLEVFNASSQVQGSGRQANTGFRCARTP
jgi:formylglycine-generating enzyme required for sulfatase activity